MMPFLLFASIPAMMWTMGSGAPAVEDQVVRAAKNGEFLWKFYPAGAASRGEQGRVGFRLTVEPDAVISSCEVTESSGFETLDKETCEIMGLYAHLKPVRNSDGRTVRASQNGFINWSLPPSVARVASAPPKRTVPKPDPVICRQDTRTDSLVGTIRMCLPRSEWQLTTEQEKQHWAEMQGKSH